MTVVSAVLQHVAECTNSTTTTFVWTRRSVYFQTVYVNARHILLLLLFTGTITKYINDMKNSEEIPCEEDECT